MCWLRVVGWRLRRLSYLLNVLNEIAARVLGRVLVRRKCIWARWAYCMQGVLYQGLVSR